MLYIKMLPHFDKMSRATTSSQICTKITTSKLKYKLQGNCERCNTFNLVHLKRRELRMHKKEVTENSDFYEF